MGNLGHITWEAAHAPTTGETGEPENYELAHQAAVAAPVLWLAHSPGNTTAVGGLRHNKWVFL